MRLFTAARLEVRVSQLCQTVGVFHLPAVLPHLSKPAHSAFPFISLCRWNDSWTSQPSFGFLLWFRQGKKTYL